MVVSIPEIQHQATGQQRAVATASNAPEGGDARQSAGAQQRRELDQRFAEGEIRIG